MVEAEFFEATAHFDHCFDAVHVDFDFVVLFFSLVYFAASAPVDEVYEI
jgi:hypothetical protein